MRFWVVAIFLSSSLFGSFAQQCGSNAPCANGMCCSQYGYCGTTSDYCCSGCQSQCSCGGPTPTPGGGVASIISSSLFDQMLLHRNDAACPANGFYTYNAFIAAANAFGAFGTTGDADTIKREIAAFLAQTSHETTGILAFFLVNLISF